MRTATDIALVRTTESVEVYACRDGFWKSVLDRHLNDVMCTVKMKEQVTVIKLPCSIKGYTQTTLRMMNLHEDIFPRFAYGYHG